MKDVLILTGAGQIGMAIARRVGSDMKIVVGDKKINNARSIAKIMSDAGFDVVAMETDISSRESIKNIIAEGQKHGEIAMLVNAAGVSPSQASIESILHIDLYGTAVLLEEVGKVIKMVAQALPFPVSPAIEWKPLARKKTSCWLAHHATSCLI